MSAGYKATPEILNQISNFALEQYTDPENNAENFKQLFINGLKTFSTGMWNPWPASETDETVYTSDYTYYKYNTADNKRRLETHLSDDFARSKLEEYGWLHINTVADIEYKVNRHGFRSDNFNADPGIVFVGCSHTYGTGLPLHSIWPSLVAKHYNMQAWNLGTPGLSAGPGTFYLLNWYKDIPNPKAIILFEPPAGRIEFYKQQDDFYSIHILKTLLDRSEGGPVVNKLYNLLAATSEINYKLHHLSLKLLAEKLNIPFVHASYSTVKGLTACNDFARDLMHPGQNTHLQVADHVINQLEKLGAL